MNAELKPVPMVREPDAEHLVSEVVAHAGTERVADRAFFFRRRVVTPGELTERGGAAKKPGLHDLRSIDVNGSPVEMSPHEGRKRIAERK